MWLPTLKYWLIRVLAEVLLCESYISIQMINMSDLGKTLITCSFKAMANVVENVSELDYWFHYTWVDRHVCTLNDIWDIKNFEV